MVSPVIRAAAALALALLGGLAIGGALAQEGADAVLGKLRPQKLQDGQCGLFLWSRSREQPFVAVAYDQPATARVQIDGGERQLQRTAFDGEVIAGHFLNQSFAEGRISVRIEMDPASIREIQDGAIISRGALRVSYRDGPESVMPVGGMIACKRA
ncbi:MAG: hypothetical protein NW200_11910 [Hyphomonadaceae bacterium]|nr:hypothetical protein [Hyphomonadaceae bacterium]